MSLSLENVSIHRGGACLAADINLTVENGETLLLTGSNGSGKTTLLRTIAGLLKPAAGHIVRPGDLHWIGPENALKPDLTVRENLTFWLSLATRAKNTDECIRDALEPLNMNDQADRLVRHLSSGQKRRAALCRLFLTQCKLWLLDEPSTGLDAVNTAQLQHLVREHTATGGTAIIATHDTEGWHANHTLSLTGGAS